MKTFEKSSKLDNVLYDVRGPVVDEAARMEEDGMEILKLNIGNPYPFGFSAPQEVILDMLSNIRTSQGYSDSKGIFSARKAIMQYAQLRGIPGVTMSDIYTGNGVSELINLCMQALLDNGDEILIPAPDYPLWTATATLAGGNVVHYICDEQSEWYPDIDDIKSKITDKTKAIVIINPNNPTGSVMTRETMAKIAELAVKHDLLVISDDVYNTLLYAGEEAPCIASFPGMKERTVIVNSFSKSYAMTGWRIGFVAAPAEIVDRMTKCQENFNACANAPGQYAATVALDHPELCEELRQVFERRRSILLDGLAKIDGIRCNRPNGAFYVFADISSFGLSSVEFCNRLLDEQKVVCIPGSAFGECGEGFIRIAYTCSDENLHEALRRIDAFCKSL